MNISKEKSFLLGAIVWLSTFQYYFVQILASIKWTAVPAFSWFGNTISDLGNTACGLYGERPVCSPLHDYMNASFILLGLTQIAGSYLLWNYFSNNKPVKIGLIFFMLAGVGTILVGLFPENTVGSMHVLGAALPFLLGNVTLVLLGLFDKKQPRWLKSSSLLLGVVALVSLALFMTQTYLGLQIGGMERLVAYPQSIWMILVAVNLLNRYRKQEKD